MIWIVYFGMKNHINRLARRKAPGVIFGYANRYAKSHPPGRHRCDI